MTTAINALELPVMLMADATRGNSSRRPTYRITLTATSDTSTYTLKLPKTNATGYLYNNGLGATEWRTASNSTVFSDNQFRIASAADATARLGFDVSGVAAATTRTITMPDVDIDLIVVDRLKNLTVAEIAQLENIGASTIFAAQWGYLSAMDQGIATTSNVTFNSIASTTTLTAFSSRFQVGTLDAAARSQVWYYGTNDADPDNGIGVYAGQGSIFRLGSLAALGDVSNVISEGFEAYGIPSAGGQMTATNYSKVVVHPNRITLTDCVIAPTTIFSVDAAGLAWRPPAALTDTVSITPALATFTVPVQTTRLSLAGPGPNYVTLTAAPLATYAVPLPAASVVATSRMVTDGTTSSWVEEEATTTNIDLYEFPATYSIVGGGPALAASVIAHGGGAPGAPTVYEITDSLAYDGGIDLTNISNIVIRGAVGQRPSIVTSAIIAAGFSVLYDGATHGTMDDVTIGNITIDNTIPFAGPTVAHGVYLHRAAAALAGDLIGTVSLKDIIFVNIDYATVGVSRGSLVTLDEQGDGDFWITNVYMERCVMRDQTARTPNSGAPQLMGIRNYVGKYNAFLWPNLTTYGADIAELYYWIRGSNVRELYSSFNRGCYAGNAAATRFMVWISQNDLLSAWGQTCSVEFGNCQFSNAIEPTWGAITLMHDPTGTPAGALQPIALNVHDCTFADVQGQAVLVTGDGLVHAQQVALTFVDNTATNSGYGVVQGPTYLSGFSTLELARNAYNGCLGADFGFGTLVQPAVVPNLLCMASMYQYFDIADYVGWTASSAAYFVTTATFAEGAWYYVSLSDGLPAAGWVDAGVGNRTTIDVVNGIVTVHEDGLFHIKYGLGVSNPEVAELVLESYCRIDGEIPPPAGPIIATQRYKLSPMLQLSTAATEIAMHHAELFLQLRAGQTIQLAIRWVASNPTPPTGAQAFYIQSARLDVVKLGV